MDRIVKKLVLLFLAFCIVACSQNKTYYDANWEETTQEKASFYKVPPIQEHGIWHIKDYYISGEKQFIGQAKDSLAIVLEGDVTWYFKKGTVQNKLRYVNGKVVGEFGVRSGAIGSADSGWNEKDLYYYDHTKVENATSATTDAQVEKAKDISVSVKSSFYSGTLNGTSKISLYINEQEDPCGGGITVL